MIQTEDAESRNVFIDSNCSADRAKERPESGLDVTTCVRPTHPIYSVGYGRYLVGEDYLRAQGMWRCDAENMVAWDKMASDDKFAQDLAGNGFSSTVAQAVFLASFISCEAWRDLDVEHFSPKSQKKARTENSVAENAEMQGPPVQPAENFGHEDVQQEGQMAAAGAAVASDERLVQPQRRLRRKTRLGADGLPHKRGRGVGAGNKKGTGKKKMISLFQKEAIMAAYEKAVADGMKKPTKAVESMDGYFDGCVYASKWAKARKQQKWTLLVQTAPELMKKHCEVPNCIRRIINMKSMKHSIAKPTETEQIHMPLPLQTVVEDLLMERIVLGEEVNMQYAKNLLVFCTELWNSVVSSMHDTLRPKALQMLKDQDEMLSCLEGHALEKRVNDMIKQVENLLRPIRIAENDGTLLFLGLYFVVICVSWDVLSVKFAEGMRV